MAAERFASPGRAVGSRHPRREDRRFLTGRGRFVDDISEDGALHAAFVRSSEAHAILKAIDTSAAVEVPGVVAVLTWEDLKAVVTPVRARSGLPSYQEADMYPLAHGKVRTVGEPIAIVIAKSRYLAEDGVDAVVVTYEPLPVITSMEQALADGAPAIHDEIPNNLYNHFALSSGDVEGAFADADEIVELEIEQQRYGSASMENRNAIASYDPASEQLTFWITSQSPHMVRTGLAKFLGIPETRIRVVSPDVGGGFGAKQAPHADEISLAAAARLLGETVRWSSDRQEDLVSTIHGREQTQQIRAAATSDGRLTGLSARIFASNGAYAPWPFTAGLDSGQAADNIPGPYDVQAYEREAHAVVTNKTPMGPYRGVGRVVSCLSIERVMDELASRLGIDRLEVRRRNLVREFPYLTAAGLEFESGDYVGAIDKLEEALDWARLTEENDALRDRGRYRGLGVAFAVEHTAYGREALASRKMEITMGYDTSALHVEPDGRVRVAVGLHSHGQGQETTIAQIAADELGIGADHIDVVYGDTAIVPYGNGTWASRSTVYCGGATILAARDVRERVLHLAAEILEASPQDLEIADGVISPKGSRSPSVTFGEVARRAYHEPHLLPNGIEPGLDSTRRYMAPDPGSFSYSVHGVQVEVDVESGEIELLRYAVVEDCGTVINPTIVEGQVHGGIAQGIGGALYEHLAYDASGQLLATSFMDYVVPGATEVPPIDIVHQETPSPHTLGGFKGMGEGGAINSPAAIVSAVNDALSGFGVVANHTPLTPEWIVAALRGAPAPAG